MPGTPEQYDDTLKSVVNELNMLVPEAQVTKLRTFADGKVATLLLNAEDKKGYDELVANIEESEQIEATVTVQKKQVIEVTIELVG